MALLMSSLTAAGSRPYAATSAQERRPAIIPRASRVVQKPTAAISNHYVTNKGINRVNRGRSSMMLAATAGGDPPVAFIGDAFPAAHDAVLEIRTVDGRLLKLLVSPTTTVQQIRKAVADQTNTQPSQVRLAYAGKELDPAQDGLLFQMKPDNKVMHTMQRMRGGRPIGSD